MSSLSGKPEKEQRQTKMSVCFTFYKISPVCIYLISRFWFIFEILVETFIFCCGNISVETSFFGEKFSRWKVAKMKYLATTVCNRIKNHF
jgi:hypothetical protein